MVLNTQKTKKDVLSAYDEKITALQNKKACAEQVYDLMKTKEFKSTLNRLPNGDTYNIFAIDTSKGKIDKDGILTWLNSIAKSLGK